MALAEDIDLFGYRMSLIANDGVEERTWSDIDGRFKIRKTADTKPNTAEIEIYNLNDVSRRFIDPKNVNIQLLAGYAKNFGLAFRGASTFTGHQFTDDGFTSRIEAQDGGIARRNTFMSVSFKEGTDISTVIERILKELSKAPEISAQYANINKLTQAKLDLAGFKPKSQAEQQTKKTRQKKQIKTEAQQNAERLKKKQEARANAATLKLKKARILRGAAMDKLDLYCRAFGLTAILNDQSLSIVPNDSATESELILLNADSGLLGIPERTETGWKIMSQLRHELNPGRLVAIDSEFLSGQFLISVVEHEGDTMTDTWQSMIEVYTV